MIKSKVFPRNDLEDVSAHCFRATLTVKIFNESGIVAAKEALNHKRISTTLSHYIKVNDRNLELNEETQFKNNKKIISSFKFNSKKIEKNIAQNDFEEINSSEDNSDNNININNEEIGDELFSINYEKVFKNENNIFLKRKRNKERNNYTNIKEIEVSRGSDNFFTSFLDETLEAQKKEIQYLKKALLESGRIILPNIENKKESYNSSNYCKSFIGLEENWPNTQEIKDEIIKSQQCIFDFVLIKN